MRMPMKTTTLLNLLLVLSLTVTGCFYGLGNFMEPPRLKKGQPMPDGPYLIFVHGSTLEKNAPGARRDRFGHYYYESIISAFENQGFYVMSEIRKRQTAPAPYADKVAKLVNDLIARDVPPNRITVMGMDKGARIALIASTIVANPKVNYILLAGCPTDRSKILLTEAVREYGEKLSGSFLSIRSPEDQETGSCNAVFANAANATVSDEFVPETKAGRILFYGPDPAWVDKAVEWMNWKAW